MNAAIAHDDLTGLGFLFDAAAADERRQIAALPEDLNVDEELAAIERIARPAAAIAKCILAAPAATVADGLLKLRVAAWW